MSIPFPGAPASPKPPARAIGRCSCLTPNALSGLNPAGLGPRLILDSQPLLSCPRQTTWLSAKLQGQPGSAAELRETMSGERRRCKPHSPTAHRQETLLQAQGDTSMTAHGACDTRRVESPRHGCQGWGLPFLSQVSERFPPTDACGEGKAQPVFGLSPLLPK